MATVTGQDPRPSGTNRIVLLYALFATLWILLSDRTMAWLLGTPDTLTQANIYKGLFFVAVTSLLLYGLMRRWVRGHLRTEENLRQEVALNQRYLDTVQTLMVSLDPEGRITMINRKGCELLGYGEEELLGRNWFATCLPQPEGMAQVYPVFQRIMAEQLDQAEYFENPVLCRDGRQRLIAWHNAYLLDDDGRVAGTLSSGQDITDQREAEEALRESEARWVLAVDSAGHGVWDWNAATNKVFFSPQWKAMLGYAEREIGDDLNEWSSRVHPDDLAACYADIERHFRGEAPTYINEHRLRCKDGSYKWILDQGRVVSRGSDGKPLRVIGTHTDIHWRRALEQQLRANMRRFRTLFESAAVAIYIHDKETGAIIDANPQALKSYGYTTLEELQRNDFWAEPPYSAEDALRHIHDAARKGPQRFEWMNRDRHGTAFWEDVHLSTIELNGIERVMATAVNITTRKTAEMALYRQTEQMRERNAELQRFNRAMVGRELEMIELKKQVNALSAELGREKPYPLAFLDRPEQKS